MSKETKHKLKDKKTNNKNTAQNKQVKKTHFKIKNKT